MSVLQFNNHTHAEDEVGIRIETTIIENQYKQPLTRVERWTIAGALRSDGSSGGLNAQLSALEQAYGSTNNNYGDATFTANGNIHRMLNSGSFSGVRVMAFGYPNGAPWKMHTELSNRRAFFAVIQAEYRLSGDLIAYREEVRRFGTGGPKWRFMPSLTGLPFRQTLQAFTPVKYVQRGQLILRSTKPIAGAAYFPDSAIHLEHVQVAEIAPTSITTNGTTQTEEMHGVEWLYPAEYATQVGNTVNFDVPTL